MERVHVVDKWSMRASATDSDIPSITKEDKWYNQQKNKRTEMDKEGI